MNDSIIKKTQIEGYRSEQQWRHEQLGVRAKSPLHRRQSRSMPIDLVRFFLERFHRRERAIHVQNRHLNRRLRDISIILFGLILKDSICFLRQHRRNEERGDRDLPERSSDRR